MSLITDALRKTQLRHSVNPGGFTPPSPNPPWRIPLIILGLAGLVVLWGSHHPSPRPGRTPPARAPTSAPPRRATFPQPIMALVPAVPAPPQLAWKVDGVIFGRGKPTAIINGEVVEEGDDLHGARVVQVNREQVELLHNGETVRLSMDSPSSER